MTNYVEQERARYWPVSRKLMAQYNDGSHTYKDRYGGLYWWQNGEKHRDGDKPAVIYTNDNISWYQNNKLHRDGDKPAIIGADGELEWWQNNERHRFNGPARIWTGDYLEWWINYENITEEVNEWLAGEEWCGTPEQIVEFQFRFC